MKKIGTARMISFLILLLISALIAGCKTTENNDNAGSGQPLYFYYAPIHYQDTDYTHAEADYITAIDYDGNWIATDNWDNLAADSSSLAGVAYYSVVETCTHWFITYTFFHPQDWTDTPEQEHENDMEGLLVMVRKDESEHGKLEAVITVFHNDFYAYMPEDSPLSDGNETIDGILSFDVYDGVPHFKTIQQAKGHGLKAWPDIEDFQDLNDQDGIIYYPSVDNAEVPSSGNDREVLYRLVSIEPVWAIQLEEDQSVAGPQLFATWGTFLGDHSGGCGEGVPLCKENSANTPWGWDDQNDGDVYRGELALDPAHLAASYFTIPGDFSQQYLSNLFLEGLKQAGYGSDNLPEGWPEELDLDSLYDRLTESCLLS